jgi:hypothetical protein
MRPLYKGLIVCAVHLLLVASLGGKLLYDRSTRPRVWARTAPYDPDLPIRGRYVSLQLEVQAQDITLPSEPFNHEQRWDNPAWDQRIPVILSAEANKLVARPDPNKPGQEPYYYGDSDTITFRPQADGKPITVLSEPVLYFIPEHIPDPSRRAAGEELWVEVTLPRKGPPRPIRLGVKKGGAITPLEIN